MSYKVLVVVGDGFKQVEEMFVSEGWELTHDIEEADLVQFVGGADVDPSLYNHHKHVTTHSDPDRDEKEIAIYTMALDRGIPMAGICRGGQLLNVLNGGRMNQDVDNHDRGSHDAYLVGSHVPIRVTSTHHQMMVPNWGNDVESKLLLVSNVSNIKVSMSHKDYSAYPIETVTRNSKEIRTDVEAVYYPGTQCLCFQPHPEYAGAKDTKDIYFLFLEQHLFGTVKQEDEHVSKC